MEITLDTLIDRISCVQHFKDLSYAALKEIVFAGQVLTHPGGSIIFHEGDPCSGMYVLIRGKVHLRKLGLQGQETIIAVINPVIMFNEATVIDKGSNPVTAVAVDDCITWQISCDRFHTLMDRYPEVGTGLLGALAHRNRILLSHIEDLVSRPILARVAKSILDMSDWGKIPINRRLHSNIEIAARVATVHEAVSRSIKTLQELGAIEYSRDEIRVSSLEQLAAAAQIEPLEFSSRDSL